MGVAGGGDPVNQGSEPPWKPTFLLTHGPDFSLVLRLSIKSQNPGWSGALCPLMSSAPVLSWLGIIWQDLSVWDTGSAM